MRLVASLIFAATALVGAAAQADEIPVKLGVLTDMSGLYADDTGPGSVAAAQLAVQDFDPAAHGMKVEIIVADHQNNPDIGSKIARQWFGTEHVNAILDVPNSAVALAVSDVAREMDKALLVSGAAISDLTGLRCSPNTVHWTYDTWMLAHATAGALVKTGSNSWFFLTSDYAFGHTLEREATAVVRANAGKVLGTVTHPLNSQDFSPFLLQAQQSKATIIALANAGSDAINAIKQGSASHITAGNQHFAALLLFITDVNTLGLDIAKGLVLTETFYWDQNDDTRAWTKRWQAEQQPETFPNMAQAGVYAETLHYLKAVAALKSTPDGSAVIAKMKAMPTDDPLFGKGYIRADGRKIHPAYLFEVKSPEESKYPGDVYKLRATIPADEAFRPLRYGRCPPPALWESRVGKQRSPPS
jgi:branched-chain amino acid transport system substrate-binding protein